MNGSTMLVETVAGGWGEGRSSAPSRDWQLSRLGPNPPSNEIQAWVAVTDATLAACGVPVELVRLADGVGQREAWRRFIFASVIPQARLLEAEIGRLGIGVGLSFDALAASDIAGRARAFQSLVGAGMDTDDAAAVTGLLSDDT